ncbi:rCG52374 [Rattus norvegicus]|uniref:RCG52374 n=1 Tax=Rattus norvegicus TaxID=10116 RepID=A6K0E2_RAT|nr:rCG52374 [Rattus norvegicus]
MLCLNIRMMYGLSVGPTILGLICAGVSVWCRHSPQAAL